MSIVRRITQLFYDASNAYLNTIKQINNTNWTPTTIQGLLKHFSVKKLLSSKTENVR